MELKRRGSLHGIGRDRAAEQLVHRRAVPAGAVEAKLRVVHAGVAQKHPYDELGKAIDVGRRIRL